MLMMADGGWVCGRKLPECASDTLGPRPLDWIQERWWMKNTLDIYSIGKTWKVFYFFFFLFFFEFLFLHRWFFFLRFINFLSSVNFGANWLTDIYIDWASSFSTVLTLTVSVKMKERFFVVVCESSRGIWRKSLASECFRGGVEYMKWRRNCNFWKTRTLFIGIKSFFFSRIRGFLPGNLFVIDYFYTHTHIIKLVFYWFFKK